MKTRITAVISFCSNDWRFLKECTAAISPVCRQIIITVCDRFFDGSKENYGLLEEAFRRFPECTFLLFHFDPEESYRRFSPITPGHQDWRHEWHNTGRHLSFFYCAPEAEWLFFLDCDEIFDNKRLHEWLKQTDFENFSAHRFVGLRYFREAKFEALPHDHLSLLVKKTALDPQFLWDVDEREGLFQRLSGNKQLGVLGCDGIPLIRHYSGVRTQEEFEKKFSCWGHHWERDWKSLIQEEFSRPFNGTDFVRRYQHREIEPAFDPLLEAIPQVPAVSYKKFLKGLRRFPNVVMVSKMEAFKRGLEHEFLFSANRHDH